MDTDPNPLQKPGRLTWLGTAVVALTAVGFGVVKHEEIGETITRLRSVDPVVSVQQPAETPTPVATASVDDVVEALVEAEAPVATPGAHLVFDIVRVESDGTTLVAGRAEPGKKVSVVVDGTAQGEVLVDASGSFVAFLDLAESDEPRVMWLMAETEDGMTVMSESSVILAPHASPSAVVGMLAGLDSAPSARGGRPETVVSGDLRLSGQAGDAPDAIEVHGATQTIAAPPAVPVVVSSDTDDSAETAFEIAALAEVAEVSASLKVQQESVQTPEQVGAVTAPVPLEDRMAAGVVPEISDEQTREIASAAPLTTPSAQPPRVLVNDLDGVRVFDAPQLADPGDLRLDTISYGADGDVLLRGRTGAGGAIHFLLSGKSAGRTVAGADGLWVAQLNDVAAGDYTLRLERLDAEGRVLNVVSLPFRRESPERLANALGPRDIQVVTVQPGATLWAIARERYGDGAQYVQVFEANKTQISDPDLIYPGQVFGLPKE